MMPYIDAFFSNFGISGWKLEVLSSMSFVIIFMCSVLAIGQFVNLFEHGQIYVLSKCFGNKIAVFICNRLLFPGTILHELSHAAFAVFSGAKVTSIHCLTLFSRDTLGYVNFVTVGRPVKRAFQLAFISCAPTITGIGFLMLSVHVLKSVPMSFGARAVMLYFVLSVADHMSMSRADAKNYLKGCGMLFVSFCVFAMVVHHFV